MAITLRVMFGLPFGFSSFSYQVCGLEIKPLQNSLFHVVFNYIHAIFQENEKKKPN